MLIALSLFIIFIHVICLMSLIHIYRRRNGYRIQQLHLLNLSVIELLKNTHYLITNIVFALMGLTPTFIVVLMLLSPCIFFLNVSAMLLLTADRLSACLLHIRYQSFCTVSRAKAAIIFIWVFSLLLIPMVITLLYVFYGYEIMKKAVDHWYWLILPGYCILFLLFAVVAYILMFLSFSKSRRRSTVSNQSFLYMFTHSKFYMAVLLVGTFLLLAVVPRLIRTEMFFTNTWNFTLADALIIVCNLSDIADGLIYILVYAPIRSLLWRFIFRPSTQARQGTASNESVDTCL